MEADLKRLVEERSKLLSDKAILRKHIKVERDEKDKLEAEREQLLRRLEHLSDDLKRKTEESEALEFSNIQLKKRCESLMDQLNSQPASSSWSFWRSNSEVDQLRSELRAHKEDLKIKIEENELVHMQIYEQRLQFKRQKADLKQKLKELRTDLANKEVEIELLLKTKEQLERILEEKNLEFDALQKVIEGLKAEGVDKAKAFNLQLSLLLEANAELSNILKQAEGRIDDKHKQMKELEVQLEEAKLCTQEAREALSRVEVECIVMQQNAGKADVVVEQRPLLKMPDELSEDVSSGAQRIAFRLTDSAGEPIPISRLTVETDLLAKMRESALHKLKELSTRASKAESEADRYRKQLNKSEARTIELEALNKELETKLKSISQELMRTKDESNKMKKFFDEASEKYQS
mmetsp:Transcript_7677/g.14488  ORF Transcript_7677/g.14488 Transcript_7677/m.14488 type:complete len:407 (+) Transcript_7677:1088-2308(+)|eukprot:CAMPEP_0204899708 /NCGR_PEP_ID=MMETSP1397-20131031/1950_1 /ASSEMBLY_ACC=CAM_ASM_000891 /TAXON_ID=49980 /ORGANISM="Climacostomum Climacostomum virens, Strain Stock W-24" /LENGTH=406 /DNA_ID=CAMNT_0052067691 /DNA_START=2251 /DNA_END=3471 /DNA_ORIENTATION=-